MNRRYHSRIVFSSLRESFDVIIQNILTRSTLDLDEGDFTRGGILGFNINAFPRPTDGCYTFPTSPRQNEADELLEILRRNRNTLIGLGKEQILARLKSCTSGEKR